MTLDEANALGATRREDEVELERIMDRYTWDAFIDMLGDICNGKGDHVSEQNHRDPAVRNWYKTARAFEKLRALQPYSV